MSNDRDQPIHIPLASPSGSYLEHTGQGSNWVMAHELPRVVQAMLRCTMLTAQPESSAVVFKHWNCKYVNIRVDMRSGHFVLVDQNGDRVDGDDEVLRDMGLAPLMPAPKALA